MERKPAVEVMGGAGSGVERSEAQDPPLVHRGRPGRRSLEERTRPELGSERDRGDGHHPDDFPELEDFDAVFLAGKRECQMPSISGC